MRGYLIYFVCVASAGRVTAQDPWTFSSTDLFDPANNMKAFFSEQKNKVEKAFTAGYAEAVKMKDNMNTYVEEQQKKISNNINDYVKSVQESGRKTIDTYSFLPSNDANSRLENPDVSLSVPAIIAHHGYTCETHTIVSQGYLLNIHRIPRSKDGNEIPRKTVLLHHGLFASSADWILNGPEKALAYVLADAGYDVWMPNIRGNKYSREHSWLKTNSKSYWNFSWHDVAKYDVPKIIDYILKTKGSDTKITYVGHSMGTTILFAMLVLRPEYNNILNAGFALAPVVFMSDIESPLKSLAPITSNVAYMEMLYGSYEFIPKHSSLGRISSSCEVDKMDFMLCKSAIFYLVGYNEKQFNKTLLPVFLTHLGTGTSWKTAVHFAQEIIAGGKFQNFDYGAYNNEKIYGSNTPPEYDLSKITLPIHLFWAQNDLLSSEKDVKKLYERLPSKTEIYMVPDPDFNHLDYLWAVDAPRLVNNKLLESLNKAHNAASNGFSFNIRFAK